MENPFVNNELLRLHHLIKTKATGTPETLAQKLHCSERTARHKIEVLKDAGLPINYCKCRQTYNYTEEVSIFVSFILGEKEMQKIVGGAGISHTSKKLKNKFHTANFLPHEK